jgi:hypothetical protein
MLKRPDIDENELLHAASNLPAAVQETIEGETEEETTDELSEDSSWFDAETKAFLASMLLHVGLIFGLAAVPIVAGAKLSPTMLISSEPPTTVEPDFNIFEDIAVSDELEAKVGSNLSADTASALSLAPTVDEVSAVITPDTVMPSPLAMLDLSTQVKQASGLVQSKKSVRGNTGEGVAGTDGAIDRITFELLQSIEERPTLVCWLMDASVSLIRRREEIRARLDRIYEELGIVQSMKRREMKPGSEVEPLLTSVIAFGKSVDLMTENPTADLKEIQQAIDGIEVDNSGVEMTFSAIYLAADRFKKLRNSRSDKGPERNVILIVVTDERGDDIQGLERSIEICRKFAIPVHVLGVPAPFGRDVSYIKYVDPDPKFDQTPQWGQIDQGPETLYPERVRLGYNKNYYEEPSIDSGFGPYAISRLCYETGGIYFTIHPNRKYNERISSRDIEAFSSRMAAFFDPNIMSRYRPDYLSEEEYRKQAEKSVLRTSLLQAGKLAKADILEKPRTRFIRRDEPSFIRELTSAQEEAARLEPALNNLVAVLQLGEAGRSKETSPRWLASYDLSFATALAAKVRTETYNLMLAKAKRGMAFPTPKNNTWTLDPSEEVSVSSKLEKEADLARKLFSEVMAKYPGTPWAYLAKTELEHPIGWSWKDSYTELDPAKKMASKAKNDNIERMRKDDEAKMLKPMAPKRAIPKL